MARYTRRVRIEAPLSDVWTFHSTIDGLEALTPEWMDLRIDRVTGPDGSPDPERLRTGTDIAMSIRPFGVGPRQSWTSRISDRDEREGYATFTDEMLGGPFALWVHTHEFYGDRDETVLVDTVDYELPFGAIGAFGTPVSKLGFEAMFRDRHATTKRLLEE
ncbi:MAG: SRPBCC family protein [Halobacteriota archaeon]